MSNCVYCNKPMTFSPSLAERSKKTGTPVEGYKRIFIAHAACQIQAWYAR